MAVMAAPWHVREPGDGNPGFPPRCGMTFGEVVSAYNKHGSSAAKRYDYMIYRQETHLPEDKCTIHEKVARKPDHGDPLKSWSSSSRGALTPGRWPATRSRTPSPWMPRRPRSLPGTPRATTPLGLRPSDSRYLKDNLDFGSNDYLGEALGAGSMYDGKCDSKSDFRLGERGRHGSSRSALDTFAVDNIVGDTFAISGDGARGRSFPSNVPTFALNGSGGGSGALGDSPQPEPLSRQSGASGAVTSSRHPAPLPDSGVAALRRTKAPEWSTKAAGLAAAPYSAGANDAGGSRRAGMSGLNGYSSDIPGRAPSQADARAASFVRLNSFLLRTHVTSLVSALAEDGWLEAWEKDRLCGQAREESPTAWLQAFFRSYMRFMETEDVPTFVASLRSQIL